MGLAGATTTPTGEHLTNISVSSFFGGRLTLPQGRHTIRVNGPRVAELQAPTTNSAQLQWLLQWRQAGVEHRLPIDRELTIGRLPTCDVVIEDPYVSRVHCTLRMVGGQIVVDARQARNPLRIDGKETSFQVVDKSPQSFDIGKSSFQLIALGADLSETTLTLTRGTSLALRGSTRELLDGGQTTLAQFSTAEFAAFSTIVRKYPDAANHAEVGQAVWGDLGYDQYQIHRLMQRIRQRLGPLAEFLENVRGGGYRFQLPIDEL